MSVDVLRRRRAQQGGSFLGTVAQAALPAIGAAVGSFVPGAGTVAGASLGTALGGAAGQVAGKAISDATNDPGKQISSVQQSGGAMQRRLGSMQSDNLSTIREGLMSLPSLPPDQRKTYAPVLTKGYLAELDKMYGGGGEF